VCFAELHLRRRKYVSIGDVPFGKPAPIRVLVVDDHEPWRRFVTTTLQNTEHFVVLGEAADGLDAVQMVKQLQPDLVLLDIGLPRLNGIEAAKQIARVSPHSKILFVSENRSRDIAEAAMETRATGYLVKSDAGNELLPAVEAVLQGKRFISASLAGQFLLTAVSTWMAMLTLGIL
jgi:DNA-binding NarL/FixJ family response regulator